MSGQALEWRYEIKGACEERAWPSILAGLRMGSLALRRHHPDRVVQSVYFDNPWHAALRDNLAGISERRKVRLRWYGAGADLVQATLEQKIRMGGVGTKRSRVLPAEIGVRGTARHRLVPEIRRVLGDPAPELDGQEPVQWIRYHREYWCSFDGVVRVTADTAVEAFDLRCAPRVVDRVRSLLPRLLILEAKVPESYRDRAQPVFEELGLRADRCSKFVLASEPLEGPRPFRWERTP